MTDWYIALAFGVASAVVLPGVYVYLVRPWHLAWGRRTRQ